MKTHDATSPSLIERLDQALSFGTTGRDALPNLLKDCKDALEASRSETRVHGPWNAAMERAAEIADYYDEHGSVRGQIGDAIRGTKLPLPQPQPGMEFPPRTSLSAIAKRDPFIVWEVENKTTRVLFSTKEAADKFVSTFPASVAGGMRIQEVGVL